MCPSARIRNTRTGTSMTDANSTSESNPTQFPYVEWTLGSHGHYYKVPCNPDRLVRYVEMGSQLEQSIHPILGVGMAEASTVVSLRRIADELQAARLWREDPRYRAYVLAKQEAEDGTDQRGNRDPGVGADSGVLRHGGGEHPPTKGRIRAFLVSVAVLFRSGLRAD